MRFILLAATVSFALVCTPGSTEPLLAEVLPDESRDHRAELRPGNLNAELSTKSVEAGAPWVRRMNGMAGGTVNDLAMDPENPGVIYAATDAGLFLSIDAGVNWQPVELPIVGRVADIEINGFDPDLMHAAVPCAYLRSTDRGLNWSATFPPTCVENVDIDPSTNRVLLHNRTGNIDRTAAAEYSADGGLTFQPLVLPDTADLTGISMDVISGTPGGYLLGYASSTRKLYKTLDNGTTWDDITANVKGTSQLSVAEVAVRPGHPSEYLLSERNFAGSGASIIHQSTNGGDTWMEVATGAFSGNNGIEFQFDPANNALVHYIDLRSTDGGFNWVNLDPSIGVRGRAQSVVASSSAASRVYAGGEGFGVEISEDGGASWARSNRGLDAADVGAHVVLDQAVVAIADRQGLFRSTDFGEQWVSVRSVGLEDQEAIAVGFAPDEQEGVATFSGAGVRTLATTVDGGQSWSVFDLTAQADLVGRVAPLGSGAALVSARSGSEAGVLRVATNGSVSGFSAFSSGISGFPPDIVLAVDPSDPNRILAAFSDGTDHVFASSNGGMSWAPTGTGLNTAPDDLRFDPTVTGRVFAVNDEGVYESLDNGATFALRSGRPAGALSIAASERFMDFLVAGRNSSGRGGLVSTDGGESWLEMTDRLNDGGNWFPRIIHFSRNGARLMARDGSGGRVGLAVRTLDSALTRLAPMTLDAGDRFGGALSTSGARIAIGVPGDDDAGSDAGAVYIYRREGTQAVLEQKIPAPAGMALGFGHAIAIDGERLVVGTSGGSVGGAKGDPLRAALFERLNQDWLLKSDLDASTSSGDEYGSVVALRGDLVLVGAPGDDESGTDSGAVYQFNFDAASLQTKIMPASPVAGGKFGQGLAIGNGVVAIGSPFGAGGTLASGVVELHERVGENLARTTTVTGDGDSPEDRFGASVALAGNDLLVVGAPGESSNAGAAYLFEYDGSNAVQLNRVTATLPATDGAFATSVAASTEQIAIGAPGRRKVFLYDRDLSLEETYDADDEQMAYGATVGLSGEALVIGAPDTNGEAGAVDVIFNVDRVFADAFE